MKNDKKQLLERWESLAQDDATMAELALQRGLYLQAAFHSQQSIEKALKGLIIFLNETEPPYTHDLARLYNELQKSSFYKADFIAVFSGLNPYYIQARYPTYKEKMADSLNKKKIEYYLNLTKEVLKWLDQSKTS